MGNTDSTPIVNVDKFTSLGNTKEKSAIGKMMYFKISNEEGLANHGSPRVKPKYRKLRTHRT